MRRSPQIFILIFFVVIIAGYIIYMYATNSSEPQVISEKAIKENGKMFPEDQSEQTKTISDELDTSEWKTYRNEEFGFELKYPPFLEMTEAPQNPSRIVSFGYCEEYRRGVTVQRCVKNEHFISVYISERTFNEQNILKAFDVPPADPSNSSVWFSMIRIGEKDMHIGANAVWNIQEWVAQMALGDRTLSFRFQGEGFISYSNDENASLEGLRKVKAILSTLKFQ